MWLWTEHTVSVADAKLAQPQGGIKSGATAKLRAKAHINWIASIFILILTSAPGGPGGPGGP